MDNSIKKLKDNLFFASSPSIVSLKKQLKFISKQIGQPLSIVQESVVKMYGYNGWHGFKKIFLSEFRLKNSEFSVKYAEPPLILSKNKPIIKKYNNVINYHCIANHGLLDESIWIPENNLMFNTNFYLNKDEAHEIYLKLLKSIKEKREQKKESYQFLFVAPSLSKIEDLIAISDREFLFLDLSLNEELWKTKYKNNITKIIFNSLFNEMSAFFAYEFDYYISNDFNACNTIEDFFTKVNLPDISFNEFMMKYNEFFNKGFIGKNVHNQYIINNNNLFSLNKHLIVYFGDNPSEKNIRFFEQIRLQSMGFYGVKGYHFFYYNKEVDFSTRAFGISCFYLRENCSIEGYVGGSFIKGKDLGEYKNPNMLYYKIFKEDCVPVRFNLNKISVDIEALKIEMNLVDK